uniref:Uncharacterized protein n=1 Tax=Rhizophora mucronata TaxID=61149 RepID=A0A2P2MZD8_RHIMU
MISHRFHSLNQLTIWVNSRPNNCSTKLFQLHPN